jgi:hypothetical protein
MKQNLNAGNERAKAEMGRGGYGSFNHATGKMSAYN